MNGMNRKKRRNMLLRVLFMLAFSMSVHPIYAQTVDKKPFHFTILIGHDIALPLFGNAFASPDSQRITECSYFIPAVMYEVSTSKRWQFGLKAGYQNYQKTTRPPVNSPASGPNEESITKELIWGGNVYAKYVLRSDMKLRPYAGAGLGYQFITIEEMNKFPSGLETVTIRKYGEFSFLVKAGLMYSFTKRIGIFTEGEYRPVPVAWAIGVFINW